MEALVPASSGFHRDCTVCKMIMEKSVKIRASSGSFFFKVLPEFTNKSSFYIT